MDCYKELFYDLMGIYESYDGICLQCEHCKEAAEAIEALLTERDAAVADLTMIGSCKTCGNRTPFCDNNPDGCKGYAWRGPRKEEETEGKEHG